MEQLYRDYNGDWQISEWKDGKKYFTGQDGHTYFKELVDEDDKTVEMVGEDDMCPCHNPVLAKKLKLRKRK